jgi:hypothetical protein
MYTLALPIITDVHIPIVNHLKILLHFKTLICILCIENRQLYYTGKLQSQLFEA